MKFELSTRSKLILLVGAPTTLLLVYWLFRDTDDGLYILSILQVYIEIDCLDIISL